MKLNMNFFIEAYVGKKKWKPINKAGEMYDLPQELNKQAYEDFVTTEFVTPLLPHRILYDWLTSSESSSFFYGGYIRAIPPRQVTLPMHHSSAGRLCDKNNLVCLFITQEDIEANSLDSLTFTNTDGTFPLFLVPALYSELEKVYSAFQIPHNIYRLRMVLFSS